MVLVDFGSGRIHTRNTDSYLLLVALSPFLHVEGSRTRLGAIVVGRCCTGLCILVSNVAFHLGWIIVHFSKHFCCCCCHITCTYSILLHSHFAPSGRFAAAGASSWMHPCLLSSLHCPVSGSSFWPLSLGMSTSWHQFWHIGLQVHVLQLPFLFSLCCPLLGWVPAWALSDPFSLACEPVPRPAYLFFLPKSRVPALGISLYSLLIWVRQPFSGIRSVEYRYLLYKLSLIDEKEYLFSSWKSTVKAGNVVTFGAQNNFFLRILCRWPNVICYTKFNLKRA